jgi:hypothetical protein
VSGPAEGRGAAVEVLGADALEGLRVEEKRRGDHLRLGTWEASVPDLACGITRARAGTYSVSAGTGDTLLDTYGGLATGLGFGAVAVPRQVHGTDVIVVSGPPGPRPGTWVWLAGRVDGLVTGARGVLLASTAADCVPVYLLDPTSGVVGLVHAGWRGVAGGIFRTGLSRVLAAGADLEGVRVHLGPAICGACYEVDGPVLGALDLPGERAHVDLRGLLARQAVAAGVDPNWVSCSAWCTRCAGAELHSHRASGGQAGRMAAFIGLRGTVTSV